MNRFKEIGSGILLLMYLASTLWISAFHSHSYVAEQPVSDHFVEFSIHSSDNSELSTDENLCIYCQFLTQQEESNNQLIQSYPHFSYSIASGNELFLPQSNTIGISERAPPADILS